MTALDTTAITPFALDVPQADLGKLRGAGYAAPVTPLVDAVADYIRNYLLPNQPLGD